MTDFCAHCALEIGAHWPNPQELYDRGAPPKICPELFSVFGFRCDTTGLTSPEDAMKGVATVVLCEGCGMIFVDPDGVRIREDEEYVGRWSDLAKIIKGCLTN